MSICFVSVYLGLDSNSESPKLAVQFLANSASRGRKRRVSDYSLVLTTQDLPAHATCCESFVVNCGPFLLLLLLVYLSMFFSSAHAGLQLT